MKKAWHLCGILYLILVITDVVSLLIGNNCIHNFIKPALMPVLAITSLLAFKVKSVPLPIMFFLFMALVFHTLGDVFLMFDGILMFKYGLLAFFMGHLFYLAILRSNQREKNMKLRPISLKRTIVYVLLAICLPILLAYNSGLPKPMLIYTTLYAWVLITLAYKATRCRMLGLRGGSVVLLGVLLFIASDSILALHSFYDVNFFGRHALVMLLYTSAQALIIYGISTFYKDLRQ